MNHKLLNYKHLIVITVISVFSSACLSACANLQLLDVFSESPQTVGTRVQPSGDRTEVGAEFMEDSTIRQPLVARKDAQSSNKPFVEREQRTISEKCYNGWQDGTYTTSAARGHIKALQVVRDCSGRSFVLSLDSEGEVSVWDLRRKMRRRMFFLPEKPGVAVFSTNGAYIGISKGSRIIILPIMAGSKGPFELSKLAANAVSMAFDPEARSIIIGATDSKVYRWAFNPQEPLRGGRVGTAGLDRYHGHPSVVSAVAFHPYGRLFFSGDWVGNLKAWLVYGSDAYKGEYDENLFGTRFFANVPALKSAARNAGERIDRIKISQNGQFLVLSAQDGSVEVWQVRGLSKVVDIQAHDGMIYDIAISPEGDRVATIARDGMLKVWRKREKEGRLVEYELALEYEIKATNLRVLTFTKEAEIVAGSVDGKVVAISIDQLAAEKFRKSQEEQ